MNAEQTIAACSREFLLVLKPYNIATFASGEIDTEARHRTVFFAIEWPARWRKFYLQSDLVERDPVIGCIAHYKGPFTWGDLRRDRLLLQIGLDALDRVRELGWSDGLVIPIPRGGTRYGLVSLVAEAPAIIGAAEKSLIALLAVCFHERVRALAPSQGFPLPPAGLTEREVQCLSLIARGCSDREVGQALQIAPSTAHEYFENAKRKLNVSGRAEAVALAVSLGIIAI
jgi:DNA-binding CsgD family transcriptional regulator